jgi:hypothetical protein
MKLKAQIKVVTKSVFQLALQAIPLTLIFLINHSAYAQMNNQIENDLYLNCKYEKSKSLKDGSLERTDGSRLLIINFLKNSTVSLTNDRNGEIFRGSYSKTEINVESKSNVTSSPQTSESFTINRITGEFENAYRIVKYDKTVGGYIHSGVCSKVEKRF